jgi:hypothetical protein
LAATLFFIMSNTLSDWSSGLEACINNIASCYSTAMFPPHELHIQFLIALSQ